MSIIANMNAMCPTFSIIIPHKNIPDLLMRCLKSIPVSEDIQVIVVDDNSADADTYLDNYPELSRPYLEFIRTTKGALWPGGTHWVAQVQTSLVVRLAFTSGTRQLTPFSAPRTRWMLASRSWTSWASSTSASTMLTSLKRVLPLKSMRLA